jgi:hypothetical protein
MSVWTMNRDGKRFSGVRWVVMVTCAACLSAVVQLLTLFSFVVVTLYMLALLVSYPMEMAIYGPQPGIPTPFYRFNVVAAAWCGYVLLASMLSRH